MLAFPRLNMCEAAVDVVRRHPYLAGEPSQRYARALLDRELAVLFLVESMLAAETDEAIRARSQAEEALRKHRAEMREVEVEHARLEAEGPASHRKRDLLDKATKE
ncbi:C2H2-type domain-containing protein, partial [Haematococcus lacustris]